MEADVVFARATSSRIPAEELDRSIDACRRKRDQFRLAKLSFLVRRTALQGETDLSCAYRHQWNGRVLLPGYAKKSRERRPHRPPCDCGATERAVVSRPPQRPSIRIRPE